MNPGDPVFYIRNGKVEQGEVLNPPWLRNGVLIYRIQLEGEVRDDLFGIGTYIEDYLLFATREEAIYGNRSLFPTCNNCGKVDYDNDFRSHYGRKHCEVCSRCYEW